VDLHFAERRVTIRKTEIGSPYVIKSMKEALAAGEGKTVVGWEANGGFLTGSVIERNGRTLHPLPTRDAALPLVSALHAAVERECEVAELFSRLPRRFSKAGLIDHFPQEAGFLLTRRFSPEDEGVQEVSFEDDRVTVTRRDGQSTPASKDEAGKLRVIREDLHTHLGRDLGFDDIVKINVIDGVRIFFAGGDIAHIRPSGNAPQLRIYAVSNTQSRADEIVKLAIEEPGGLLRRLEASS
jgi:phosphomannomutase